MNKLNLKGRQSNLFFVIGAGFVEQNQARASVLSEAQIAAINTSAGLLGTETGITVAVPVVKSFAVSFVRLKDIQADGTVAAHRLNPSTRRFASEGEANTHGNRFKTIEKHKGFYVVETNDPVNSWVNQATGKTNPLIGKARTNR